MISVPERGSCGRLLAALLTVLCLAAPVLVDQPSAAATAGRGASAHDARLDAADCDLLGRDFDRHLGCSRTRCEPGAVLWRTTYGAEACTLRGAPKGYGFAATVDARVCAALHRRWIAEVNYCASEPDRTIGSLFGAPQCLPPATVYVTLRETEGYYDECITTDRVSQLLQWSALDGATLEEEASLRSSVQCPYRPGHVFVLDTCVVDPGFQPTGGGVLVIGDSLAWRGSDELGRLQPSFTLDGQPARPLTDLAARLAHYRTGHGNPSGLIIELGTVPAKAFKKRDLVKVLRSLPRKTSVMFVLPYFAISTDPVTLTPKSKRVAGWMRELARQRRHSCMADWPAYVGAHPGILQDGVHTKHRAEGRWAHWISRKWRHC